MCMTVEPLPCEAGKNIHVEAFNMDILLQIQETILARHNFEFWHPKLGHCEAKSPLKVWMYPASIDDGKANVHEKIPFTSLTQVLPMEPEITDPSYSLFLLIFLPMSSWKFLQLPWVSLTFLFSLTYHWSYSSEPSVYLHPPLLVLSLWVLAWCGTSICEPACHVAVQCPSLLSHWPM